MAGQIIGEGAGAQSSQLANVEDISWLNTVQTDVRSLVSVLAKTVEVMDLYTAYHQKRVAKLACAIAREMLLSEDQVRAVVVAGLLHDIGNIYVPEEILYKVGALDTREFSIVQDHASVGYYILSEINFPWPVAEIVLQHHERVNGSGYPGGMPADEMRVESKVLAVADVVGAMTSVRRHRPPLGLAKALVEIRQNSNILYDAAAVACCLRLFSQGRFHFD